MLATFKQYWKSALEWTLKRLLKAHGKRLMFVVTLYYYLKNGGKDTEDLEELNRTFKLAESHSALVLPGLAFTHWIWPKENFAPIDLQDEALVERLLRDLPDWLRYGREEDIRKDILGVQHFLGR